jgi:HPt (histidine-containing phosphotransfer) domain-containing protein
MPEPFHDEDVQSGLPAAAAVDRGAVRQLQEQLGDGGAAQLVTAFLDRAPDRLIALRAAAGEGSASKLREYAHSMKGTSRSFGAAEMGEIAARLEQESAAGSLENAGDLVAALAASFERTRTELEQQVRQPSLKLVGAAKEAGQGSEPAVDPRITGLELRVASLEQSVADLISRVEG